jgi:hypothetical protein
MKRIKRLLSLGIAMVLVFTALSAGMVVHAESKEVKASEAFASITVDGTSIDLKKCPKEYIGLGTPSKVKIEWALQEGWTLSRAQYAGTDSMFKDFKSGDSLSVPKNGLGWAILEVSNEAGDYCYYDITLYKEKAKLSPYTLWAGQDNGALVFENLYSDLPLVSVKSSDTSIIKVKAGKTLYASTLKAKKAGKSKITVEVKINGKKQKYSATYTVKKYPNALSSLNVAGKKVNFKKNKFTYTLDSEKFSHTISNKNAKKA